MRYRLLSLSFVCAAAVLLGFSTGPTPAQKVDPVDAEGQPLAQNADRLLQALEFLGASLAPDAEKALRPAIKAQDARKIQEILDPHAMFLVNINPESRVKVKRGPAVATLQQGGYTPVLIKVVNEAGVTKTLNIGSPQAGPIYSGGQSKNDPKKVDSTHFLDVEMYRQEPMTEKLSGVKAEYAIGMIYSKDSGKREATFQFD